MWEYAALFNITKPTELELAAHDEGWWQREGCDLRVGQMGYRTTTTIAGDTLVAEVYPTWGRKMRGQARKAKRNLTPERIRKYNKERAKFYLQLLMDANFTEEDQSLTLTYIDGPTEAEAQKDVKNFIERLRRARKKKGLPELKYIYALEDERDGRRKKLHCHIVMSGGMERKEVEKIWRAGSQARGYANCDQLQPNGEGLRQLAFYIYEQNRGKNAEKSRRHYSCSKNLTKPKSRTSMSRVSNAKAKKLARDFNGMAKPIMEKVYPGYEFVRGLRYEEHEDGTMSESCVRISDYTGGVYIRVMMRKIPGRGQDNDRR